MDGKTEEQIGEEGDEDASSSVALVSRKREVPVGEEKPNKRLRLESEGGNADGNEGTASVNGSPRVRSCNGLEELNQSPDICSEEDTREEYANNNTNNVKRDKTNNYAEVVAEVMGEVVAFVSDEDEIGFEGNREVIGDGALGDGREVEEGQTEMPQNDRSVFLLC